MTIESKEKVGNTSLMMSHLTKWNFVETFE